MKLKSCIISINFEPKNADEAVISTINVSQMFLITSKILYLCSMSDVAHCERPLLFNFQGCEWEFKKRAEIELKTPKMA